MVDQRRASNGTATIDLTRFSVRHRVIVFAALLVVFSASEGPAQQSKPAPAQPLSRATFIATMDAEFRRLDTNRDQIVVRSELQAKERSLGAAAAARMARTVFAQMDIDRNGQISVDEYIKAIERERPPADGSGMMVRLDTNRDQKVTMVEYRILTLSTFDQLDTDRDGVLTPAEQRASNVAP